MSSSHRVTPPPGQVPSPPPPPSLRINLSATAAAAASPASAQPSPSKRAKHNPLPDKTSLDTVTTSVAGTDQVRLLHQRTQLSFAWEKDGGWTGGGGTTTLYVLHLPDENDKNNASSGGGGGSGTTGATATAATRVRMLPLHARNSLRVTHVSVQTVVPPTPHSAGEDESSSASWHTCEGVSCSHADALSCVLTNPVRSGRLPQHGSSNDDDGGAQHGSPQRCQADAQSSRGAVGMTNALRAASIHSHFGELRLSYHQPTTVATAANASSVNASGGNNNSNDTAQTNTAAGATTTSAAVAQAWLDDLLDYESTATADDVPTHRRQTRRKRFTHVARTLAQPPVASSVALKITIAFSYPSLSETTSLPSSLPEKAHWGGWHVVHRGLDGPTVYTTAGTYGDGQGPRTWVPCLDSAHVAHRASHQLTIRTTAPAAAALQAVGAGETAADAVYAIGHTAFTTTTGDNENGLDVLAAAIQSRDHVHWWHQVRQRRQQQQQHTAVDVIPPPGHEEKKIRYTSLYVTHVFRSSSWAPVPIRSMGFAIGPFAFVEDPEYFSKVLVAAKEEEEEDETDNTNAVGGIDGALDVEMTEDPLDTSQRRRLSREASWQAFLATVRQRGEGIRQAFFLPAPVRPHVFAQTADWSLVSPTIVFQLSSSATARQDAQAWEDTIMRATVGVPHRALSLMRDVLAVPTYRTASYTQIWIPHAVDGGNTSGALVDCPEVSLNPFLGGAIFDARLLPPIGLKLPYAQGGGRALQYMQARAAIRGWIRAALPLGGDDDVGFGYIHVLVESLLFSLYERGHGGYGQGGGPAGFFYSRRYAPTSGLNSSQLDFLPLRNIEDMSLVVDGVAAVPIEERQTDHMWRSTVNGSESHTSAVDEFQVRSMIGRDIVEALERGVDKDSGVPTGSMGWLGSHLSLTFLSSNAASSSLLGCGALELMHPVSGLVYQYVKTNAFRGIVEGRTGIPNFVRLVRAAFLAAHLGDIGEKELKLPRQRGKKNDDAHMMSEGTDKSQDIDQPKPPFVVCVNEILSKKGLTHTLFTRALQNICGRLREGLLAGTLVDVERLVEDPRTRLPFVDPEGFPNSYVRAASTMYCRVGVQVEQNRDVTSSAAPKGVQCQLYAEPVVPKGGIAFGGPITVRIVENEGQFRESVKQLVPDGSRRDWGAQMLHMKPVTTLKAQTSVSGTIEKGRSTKDGQSGDLAAPSTGIVFTESNFHTGGYQALELVRLTNLTPLLWVRVDPLGAYGGKISVSQPDACFAEQLFYDGDATAQMDALRSLAERPFLIQSTPRVSAVHNVNVDELPIRVLGDCLRGSPALHSSLPHTPVIRANAALCMAQWQNNKAPQSRDISAPENWIGLHLLMQYFKERFCSGAVIMPVKFTRIAFKKSEAETRAAAAASDNGIGVPKATHDDGFYYFDTLGEGSERAAALSEAEDVETEEDEEYRVRSACVTAIASIRAKDGKTPIPVIKFLETILEAEDASMMSNIVHPDDDVAVEKAFHKMKAEANEQGGQESKGEENEELTIPSLPYASNILVADALLSLCHINATPATCIDPTTGRTLQVSGPHPLARLMALTLDWLEWEFYREKIRREVYTSSRAGTMENCYDLVAPCAVLALANLAIMKQSTTSFDPGKELSDTNTRLEKAVRAGFYADIFDSKPCKNDLTRAAAAQAFTSLCCAADRIEIEGTPPVGLLTALQFMLDRIIESETSPSLRHTLASLMMDACTGKIASMQRVGAIAGRSDLIVSAGRFFHGPLGASNGGDNGSALLMSVSAATHPSASAVNDGARRGLRLLSRAGHPKTNVPDMVVVKVAMFATKLWRTINGEEPEPSNSPSVGVCAFDGKLRCALLALWQWLWPKDCYAVSRVQDWRGQGPPGSEKVMSIQEDEKQAAAVEEYSLAELSRLVDHEIDRQVWRGEMAEKAYELSRNGKKQGIDIAATEQGLHQPLPPIKRDTAFKQGGWGASWAQQRREAYLDGGGSGTKVRLKVAGR